jgi:ribosomal-protein-alanine N-acetyltransferase
MSLAQTAATESSVGAEQTAQPNIEAPRLHLRPIAASDILYLHAPFSDPETMRFMDFPPARDVAQSMRYLSTYLIILPEWNATWAMVRRETGAVIGFVNYHHRENSNRRLEVGFMLSRPYWGRGLMAEALSAVLDYCFDALEMERVEATMSPQNLAACRMVERLGFQYEGGPLRRRQRVGNEYRDLSIYGILRDEWRARATAFGGATSFLEGATS